LFGHPNNSAQLRTAKPLATILDLNRAHFLEVNDVVETAILLLDWSR